MCLTLDTLELTEEETRAAREEVRRLAYLKWEQAGCSHLVDPSQFWCDAEQEWIDFYYVPDRYPSDTQHSQLGRHGRPCRSTWSETWSICSRAF